MSPNHINLYGSVDGKHAHEPWSSGRWQWHTADEAEYPDKFCEIVAKCFSGAGKELRPAKYDIEHAEGAMAAAKGREEGPTSATKAQ